MTVSFPSKKTANLANLVMGKRMFNTLVTRFFYRQVAKAAKKS